MGRRLIDVDVLKAVNGMKDDCADCDKELRGKSKACEFDRVYTKMDFCGWLEDAPTVDAVPVRHGRWIHHKGGYSDHYECTACGKSIVLTSKWDFCPMCGALMDGKDGEPNEADIRMQADDV